MYEPDLYLKANTPQRCDVKDLSEEFVDEIGKMSGSCIDVGSGPGDVANDLILPKLNTKATIVCSDISEKMLDFGRERYRDNVRMSFVQLDIETPNLPEDLVQRFDHVLSFYCIHWCQDLSQVFENMFNLLRPGGTSLLTFLTKSSVFDAYKILEAMPCYQPYMKDVDRFIPALQHVERPREILEALLKEVGFENPHSSIREKRHYYDTPESLGKFMASVNPFIERIPTELKDQYRNDLTEEVVKVITVFNNDTNHKDERHVLQLAYDAIVLHLKKPATNSTIQTDD